VNIFLVLIVALSAITRVQGDCSDYCNLYIDQCSEVYNIFNSSVDACLFECTNIPIINADCVMNVTDSECPTTGNSLDCRMSQLHAIGGDGINTTLQCIYATPLGYAAENTDTSLGVCVMDGMTSDYLGRNEIVQEICNVAKTRCSDLFLGSTESCIRALSVINGSDDTSDYASPANPFPLEAVTFGTNSLGCQRYYLSLGVTELDTSRACYVGLYGNGRCGDSCYIHCSLASRPAVPTDGGPQGCGDIMEASGVDYQRCLGDCHALQPVSANDDTISLSSSINRLSCRIKKLYAVVYLPETNTDPPIVQNFYRRALCQDALNFQSQTC